MAITKFILLPLLQILSLLPLSSSHSISSTLLHAADILSNSGYLSMSLTLQLVSTNLPHTHYSPSLTIFSPSDYAFSSSGQPSLSLLEFHFSPLPFPLRSLKKLPSNSKIPTLAPNHSLVITSSPSDCNVSLNGVKITQNPIYNDKLLIIHGVNEFFNPGYHVSDSLTTDRFPISRCGFSFNQSINAFEEASEVLRSKGCFFMVSFLELLLLGFNDEWY